jgi:hypothetical protein
MNLDIDISDSLLVVYGDKQCYTAFRQIIPGSKKSKELSD